MTDEVTLEDARDSLEALGQWMECRYHIHFIGQPIQKWKMPAKEKAFFTCYAMNLVVESEGATCLKNQKAEDVGAFVQILKKVGAKKTALLVQSALETFDGRANGNEDNSANDYYRAFAEEKVWLRLLDFVGRGIYMRYLEKAQRIEQAGENIFDHKQWQG